MSVELFRALVNSTIATSIAVAMVGLLRRPVRAAAGARVAYWLWLLVPAIAVGVLLPAPKQVYMVRAVVLPEHISSTIGSCYRAHNSGSPNNAHRHCPRVVGRRVHYFGGRDDQAPARVFANPRRVDSGRRRIPSRQRDDADGYRCVASEDRGADGL